MLVKGDPGRYLKGLLWVVAYLRCVRSYHPNIDPHSFRMGEISAAIWNNVWSVEKNIFFLSFAGAVLTNADPDLWSRMLSPTLN